MKLIYEWQPPEPPGHEEVAQAYRIYEEDDHIVVQEFKDRWSTVSMGSLQPLVTELLRRCKIKEEQLSLF